MAQAIGYYCVTLAILLLLALMFANEQKSDHWQLRRSIVWIIHSIMVLASVIAFK